MKIKKGCVIEKTLTGEQFYVTSDRYQNEIVSVVDWSRCVANGWDLIDYFDGCSNFVGAFLREEAQDQYKIVAYVQPMPEQYVPINRNRACVRV